MAPSPTDALEQILAGLNPEQRRAVAHAGGPLLVIAGAGTGKTTTLAHRVAHLIAGGVNPGRILLLTFARRAAAELQRRVEGILRRVGGERAAGGAKVWGGTFHSVAARLLRIHGEAIGLGRDFTIHDRADSEDLMGVLRAELGLAKEGRRFPSKSTCVEIYSRCVNARQPLGATLDESFPWCREHLEDLKTLFRAFVDRKGEQSVLDYDDLLLFWRGLLGDPGAGARVRERFDCVLVDEYQDTNALQAEILQLLNPGGAGLTVVGDDAQAIYSFRAATVRNILDFPAVFPGTTVITLEENYRSTPPLLAATNQIIAEAAERYEKTLRPHRAGGEPPALVTCDDEPQQTEYVIRAVLARREAGVALREQAILFRASHHSLDLELELGRRNIPFHKFGGLRFLEAAHVKDLLAFLRLCENPRDLVSGSRVLMLLPGVGARRAQHLMGVLAGSAGNFAAWGALRPPAAAAALWPDFVRLRQGLAASRADVAGQVQRVRELYARVAADRYDGFAARLRDLEQLEQVAARYPDRATFLTELTLDPPASTQELAGPPQLDDDYLVLSTIHSAKGLEFRAVYVIHAADGNIPSDLSTGRPADVEEERRLFYVALTRAKDALAVCFPLRYYTRPGSRGDGHTYAQLTRFLSPRARDRFAARTGAPPRAADAPDPAAGITSEEIRRQIRDLWG
ncbi:MAG TPA: ATP-dependent helicase [Polyangia bacterium]